MSLNCKLDRNISLSQSGEGVDGCNGQDITMGVGGIASPVLVYNISDVPSLTFEGDNRSDYSLYVETINSTGQFYKVDHTDATYNEEYDPATHKWTHTLTLTVGNIQPLFEDILSDGVNGKYLVCFRPNGAEDYRMFGWKFGATLDYSLNIQSDSLGYTLTFEDSSEYPLFTVARDNFGDKNKTYTPIYTPLYDVYYCEQDSNGKHTGYIIAMYVVKVNSAGQPLGSDNKLCQWTGKKQDAYKISNIQSDGGYNIIGTYQKTATFDGKPVKVYDLEKCPANVTNSIFINSKKAETINLNSTISAGTFTITSTNDWMMVTDPQFVTISPVEGVNGNTQCSLHHNGVGGCEQIRFMNKITTEIVTLDVCVNLITVGNSYTFDCNTSEIVITPTVEGCSSAYTYTVSPTITHSKDAYGYIHLFPAANTSGTYTITMTHGCDNNETKVTTVEIVCHSTDPQWQLEKSWCEMNGTGYTNYRITRYIDINPYSSTYNTRKEEKAYDATCSTSPATWVNVGSWCELSNGLNTGYYITQEMDMNSSSPTYGNTRETKVLNKTECPDPDTDPNWIDDESFSGYCEQIYYEPSHTLANSGYWVGQEIDDNRYSATYRQTREKKTLSSNCPKPDTTPNVEEVSYSCVLTEDEDGNLMMNGDIDITGLDTNIYSATYLEVTTVRDHDEERCPPNHHAPTGCNKFIVDGGEWNNVPNTGGTTCDSAFLYYEGVPVFEPSSASNWVNIDFYYWDTDQASDMCSPYNLYPCVANNLMYDAGLVDDEVDCSTASTTLTDYPQVVQDAVNKTGKYGHSLGTVRYTVSANTGAARQCTIKWLVDSTECPSDEFTIKQLAGGGETCGCSTFSARTASQIVPSTTSSTEYLVGYYTGASNCSDTISVTGLRSGTDFLGSFRLSNGGIYAKVKTANPSSSRSAQYWVEQASCKDYFSVTQAGDTPASNVFQWQWAGHETTYSTGLTGSLGSFKIVPFDSVLNGVTTNAVISADVPWIVTTSATYVNNNELRPGYEETVGVERNTTGAARTGTMTLTQKGTSNTITCVITQQPYVAPCNLLSFTTGASEVCQGTNLTYSFTTNSECASEYQFYLIDSGGNYITSRATPSGGSGSGSFNTTNAATGQAYVSVVIGSTPTTYNVLIKDCSTPPEVCRMNIKLTNSTGSLMYADTVDFVGTNLSVSLGQTYIISNGGSITATLLVFDCSYKGASFTGVNVRDTQVQHKGYSTTSTGGIVSKDYQYEFVVDSMYRESLSETNNEEEENKEENSEETK